MKLNKQRIETHYIKTCLSDIAWKNVYLTSEKAWKLTAIIILILINYKLQFLIKNIFLKKIFLFIYFVSIVSNFTNI